MKMQVFFLNDIPKDMPEYYNDCLVDLYNLKMKQADEYTHIHRLPGRNA